MGFLAVCWEEQRGDLQTVNKAVRLKTQTPACTREHIKKALTTTAKKDPIIFINKSHTSALSHLTTY